MSTFAFLARGREAAAADVTANCSGSYLTVTVCVAGVCDSTSIYVGSCSWWGFVTAPTEDACTNVECVEGETCMALINPVDGQEIGFCTVDPCDNFFCDGVCRVSTETGSPICDAQVVVNPCFAQPSSICGQQSSCRRDDGVGTYCIVERPSCGRFCPEGTTCELQNAIPYCIPDRFVEPDWYARVKENNANAAISRVKRCYKRRGLPPVNGTRCAVRPKTCFFGNQECGGEIGGHPETKCTCSGRDGDQTWTCQEEFCPTVFVGEEQPNSDF